MNLKEIEQKGITKIRLEKWANPNAHLSLYKDDKGYGLWTTLVDDWGRIALGEEEYKKIKKMLIWDAVTGSDWVEYIPKTPILSSGSSSEESDKKLEANKQ